MISKHLFCVFVVLSATAFSLKLEQEEAQSFLKAKVDSEEESKTLYFVTTNAKKADEVSKIIGDALKAKNVQLSSMSYEVKSSPDGLASEVATAKAKAAVSDSNKGPFLAEAVELRLEANPADNLVKASVEKILAEANKSENKNATVTSVFVYLKTPESEPQVFKGEAKGKIVEARGENGFGWDPIFLPDGYDKTYGELDAKTKNSISSRRLALDKFVEYVNSNPEWI